MLDLDLTAPLPDLWAQFDALRPIPMLAIRGEHSSLLSPETFAARSHRRASGTSTVLSSATKLTVVLLFAEPPEKTTFIVASVPSDPWVSDPLTAKR